MRTRSCRGLAAAVLVTGMIAAGCGSDEPAAAPPPPPPTRIEGRLAAAADVNPDIDRNPSPILVRLYELKAETAFSNADFFQLHDDDTAVLGADLVAKSEHILVPGETVKFSRDGQVLAVAGGGGPLLRRDGRLPGDRGSVLAGAHPGAAEPDDDAYRRCQAPSFGLRGRRLGRSVGVGQERQEKMSERDAADPAPGPAGPEHDVLVQ